MWCWFSKRKEKEWREQKAKEEHERMQRIICERINVTHQKILEGITYKEAQDRIIALYAINEVYRERYGEDEYYTNKVREIKSYEIYAKRVCVEE